MARTVLSTGPNRRATCRADALSHACATASSTLTEWRFTRKQRNSLHLHSAVRTFHPVDLDVYRGSEFAPGQIPHRSFTAVVYLGELSAANRTFQLAVPAFAVHPQIQGLSLLIDSLPVHPVTGPLQDAGELVVCRQPPNLPQSPTSSKARQSARTTDSRSAPQILSALERS